MRVAFQGEIGAFSEEAVRALFGDDIELVPCSSFEIVFDEASAGDVDRSVIPIENSLHGSVHTNYDLLRDHDLHIVGELELRIRHCLMALPGVTMKDVQRVFSHPQALGQCQDFLRAELPDAEVIPAYDTAGAARMIADKQLDDAAAIASQSAAGEYHLNILAAGIESNHQNYTRFLVLNRQPRDASSNQTGEPIKTSLVFALNENVPGALFKSLAVFALRDLDLFKIESRPLVGSPGQYLFYLDVESAVSDEPLERALDHLHELTSYVKVLGSYPVGKVVEGGESS